jgi:hypothetical protein
MKLYEDFKTKGLGMLRYQGRMYSLDRQVATTDSLNS